MNSIREYRNADAKQLEACIAELQDYCKLIDSHIADGKTVAKTYLGHLLTECSLTKGKIFVAESDQRIVGMVCVFAKVQSEEPDEEQYEYAYVSDLVVLASERKAGLGRRLLMRAEEHARSEGATLLRIGVLAENLIAKTLYLKAGFKERSETLQKWLT